MAVAVHEARAAELNAAVYSLKEALAARQPVGEVVVTKNDAGHIVAVARQDDEGRILSVIAESDSHPVERASPELYAAARDFYNETVADPSVRISCASPAQRAVVTAAGERLRAALVTHSTQAEGLGQFRALLEELINRSGDSLTADQFLLAGRLLNLIDRTK